MEDAERSGEVVEGDLSVSSSSESAEEMTENFSTDTAEEKPKDQEPEEKVEASETPEAPEEKPEDKPENLGKPRDDPRARVMAATRKLADERERNRVLEAQLEEARRGTAPPAEEPAPGEPAEPVVGDFATYEEFVKASGEWAAEQKYNKLMKERDTQTATDEHVTRVLDTVDTFNARLEAAKASDPDILDKVDPKILEMYPTFMLPPNVAPGPENAIAEAMLRSTKAPALMVHFTEHPEEMDALAKLPDTYSIFEAVGALGERLGATAPVAEPEPEPAPASKAKPPPPIVSSSPQPEADEEPPDDMPFDEHMRVMNARDARNRRIRG